MNCGDCEEGYEKCHCAEESPIRKTSLYESLRSLAPGDSLVTLNEMGRGYYLHIGDNFSANTWGVTKKELVKLRDLLNSKFPLNN